MGTITCTTSMERNNQDQPTENALTRFLKVDPRTERKKTASEYDYSDAGIFCHVDMTAGQYFQTQESCEQPLAGFATAVGTSPLQNHDADLEMALALSRGDGADDLQRVIELSRQDCESAETFNHITTAQQKQHMEQPETRQSAENEAELQHAIKLSLSSHTNEANTATTTSGGQRDEVEVVLISSDSEDVVTAAVEAKQATIDLVGQPPSTETSTPARPDISKRLKRKMAAEAAMRRFDTKRPDTT